MAEKKVLHNGRELLESCTIGLNENQSGEMGGNVALYPTVVVMLGERCKAYTKFIKDTLDDNWNNSGFLQYVSIEKSGDDWSCARLTDVDKKRTIQWDGVEGKPAEVVSKAIVEMLEEDDKIFRDKSRIKMEFVMDAVEEDGGAYYDLYVGLKNGLHSEDLKTFFLMLDQKPEDNKNEKTARMLHYVVENRTKPGVDGGTTYLLSNYLDNGSILGENKIWQNYRLLADIILLGGTRANADESGYVTNLYNGVKTASYALVPKPTDEIAAVALQALMREMHEQEKERYSKELTDKEVRERLGMKVTGGFALAEEIFKEKIMRHLPSPEELRYLPFRSEKELREMQRAERISDKMADDCTMGVWPLVQQEKYVDVAERFLENEEELDMLRKRIQELLYSAFSLFEVRMMIPRRDLIRAMLREELNSEGESVRVDYTEKLHKKAVYECRKCFYEKTKQILSEEFDRMLDDTKRYGELYARCEREVQQGRIMTEDNDVSIERTYTNEVKLYVNNKQKINAGDSAFPEVFNPRLEQEGLLEAIQNAFMKMIGEEIYRYDFERELDFRMNNMTDVNRQIYVTQELQKALEGSIRLKDQSMNNLGMKISCFYMINKSADYARQLANQEGHGRDFMLFNLNRTDCIEQIEIYNITQAEKLHLSQQGGIEDENQGS